MNTRDAWRWPLKSRGRLIALVLAGLALADTVLVADGDVLAAVLLTRGRTPIAPATKRPAAAPVVARIRQL